jgi:Cupin superfamily protein
MTFADVQAALEKGTVIMNAAGAHIPKLAGPCLACCHGSLLPAAVNLYVTSSNKRTSAPPHTDKQDVVVIQSTGQKYWKVYAPPDASRKPKADIFARGKMNDDLPLYALEKSSPLLLAAILHPGDVLFVPAAFPHTTGTVINNNNNKTDTSTNNSDESVNSDEETTSIHLTYGLDHHIWDLDYLSARRLALRRARVTDTALGGDHVHNFNNDALRYVGRCNELPHSVHRDLFAALPLGLLARKTNSEHGGDGDDDAVAAAAVSGLIQQATATLKDVSRRVDEHFHTTTFGLVDENVWQETIERLVQQGVELLETHVDMYLAAMEERRVRQAEDAMTAHLSQRRPAVMSPERIQRMSLFRVKRYYDEISNSKQALQEWAMVGNHASSGASSSESNGRSRSGASLAAAALPANWAFTMPVHVGDDVEADLGGAFFAAKISRIGPGGDSFDVQFFDGDRESGLERSQIKLLKPPRAETIPTPTGDNDDVDTTKMTAKQLKRWKKQQEKLKKT